MLLSDLTPDKSGTVKEAKLNGFSIHSGFRLQPRRALHERRRDNYRPYIIGRTRANDALVEVDGATVATIPLAELTEAAQQITQRELEITPKEAMNDE